LHYRPHFRCGSPAGPQSPGNRSKYRAVRSGQCGRPAASAGAGAWYARDVESTGLQTLAPYLQQLSFGGIAGFAAGYALKKLGKLVALGVGLLFIALQLLAYYGFISVDWGVVQSQVDPLLEPESLNRMWDGLVALLTYNITFALAFVPGLIFGLRRG
jgi:uncharacterized membrane protein (Fun14 family)